MEIKHNKLLFSVLNLLTIVTDIFALACEAIIIAFILSNRFSIEINPFIIALMPKTLTTASFVELTWSAVGCASIIAFSIYFFIIQNIEKDGEVATRWFPIQRGIIILTIIVIAALYVLSL